MGYELYKMDLRNNKMLIYSLICITFSHFQAVSSVCITSCDGLETANYQFCESCHMYITCVEGVYYPRPCTSPLVWDDNVKDCRYTSDTCSQSEFDTDLVGFWPLNCKYEAMDVTENRLSANYIRGEATEPILTCGDDAMSPLSGAYSFDSNIGGVVSPKHIQTDSAIPDSVLSTATGITWIGYIMLPDQTSFSQSEAPIFSLGRNPTWSSRQGVVGLGVFWASGNIQVVASNDVTSQSLMTLGIRDYLRQNVWYKLLITVDLLQSQIILRVGKVSDLADYRIANSPFPALIPYTGGAIRFGYLDPNNNGGNDKAYTGSLSCVQLWKKSFTSNEISNQWGEIPDRCQEHGALASSTTSQVLPSTTTTFTITTVPTTTLSPQQICEQTNPCTNQALSSQPDKSDGVCVPTATSYYCECDWGYRWEDSIQVCVDVDETRVQNCGCDDVCINRYVDVHGEKYECSCTMTGKQLGPDGHKCIDILEDPVTLKVWPSFGPRAGGTLIYIEDTELTTGISVYIGTVRQTTNIIEQGLYEVITSELTDLNLLNQVQDLTIEAFGEVYAELQFTYMDDPEITSVQPLRAIAAGGTVLTVSGSHLDSVAAPVLHVYRDDTSQEYSMMCSSINRNTMHCPTPTIDTLTLHDYTPSDRRKRQAADERELNQVYLGFEMDGVDDYQDMSEALPEFSTVSVYMNPEFESFPGDGVLDYYDNDVVDVKGAFMDTGASMMDYNLYVEEVTCEVLSLASNAIICLPPNPAPPILASSSRRNGLHNFKLYVGYMSIEVGHLRYKGEQSSSTFLIAVVAGSVVGGLILLIVIIGCIICCRRKFSGGPANKAEMYEDHHDFTYRGKDKFKEKSKSKPPSLKTVNKTIDKNKPIASRNNDKNQYSSNQSSTGAYSNAYDFSSDFQMKMARKDENKKEPKKDHSYLNMAAEQKAEVSQDYEVIFEKDDKKKQNQPNKQDYSQSKDNNKKIEYIKKDNKKNNKDYLNNSVPLPSAGAGGLGRGKETMRMTGEGVEEGLWTSGPGHRCLGELKTPSIQLVYHSDKCNI